MDRSRRIGNAGLEALELRFESCWRYRLGGTNEEGWWPRQCRFSLLAPGWGFCEVAGERSGLLGVAPATWCSNAWLDPPGGWTTWLCAWTACAVASEAPLPRRWGRVKGISVPGVCAPPLAPLRAPAIFSRRFASFVRVDRGCSADGASVGSGCLVVPLDAVLFWGMTFPGG